MVAVIGLQPACLYNQLYVCNCKRTYTAEGTAAVAIKVTASPTSAR